jgi:hypothetical protein
MFLKILLLILSKKLTKIYNITISRGYIYWILNKNITTHKKIQKNTYPYDKIKFKNALKYHKNISMNATTILQLLMKQLFI